MALEAEISTPLESAGGALVESPGLQIMTGAPGKHPLFGISNAGIDQSQDQLDFSGLGSPIFIPYGDIQLNQGYFWGSGVWSNMFWTAAYAVDPNIPIVIKTFINSSLAAAWKSFFSNQTVDYASISAPVNAGDYCYLYANVSPGPTPQQWQLSVWRIDDNFDTGFPGQWYPSLPDRGPMPLTIGGIACYPTTKAIPTYPTSGVPGFHYTLPGFHLGNSMTVWQKALGAKGCVSIHTQVGGLLSPPVQAFNLPQAANIPFCIAGFSAAAFQTLGSSHVLIFWIGLKTNQLPISSFDPTLPQYSLLILKD